MTPKRIVLIIMCTLLTLVVFLSGVLVGRVGVVMNTVLQSPTPQKPTGTTGTTPSETIPQVPTTHPTTPTVPTIPSVPSTPTTPTNPNPTEPSDHDHEFTLISSVLPSCKAHGSKTYQCQCGYLTFEDVPALGCLYDHGQIVAPTCTEDGYTRYVCQRCAEIKDIEPVSALGHQWDQGTAKEASCTQDACTEYRCTTPGCEEIRLEDVQEGSATGHQFGEWVAVPDGGYARICQQCAAVESSNALEITQTISGVVTDVEGNQYTLYEIYVGTQESPAVFRYLIYDYTNADPLLYRYDPMQGLIVTSGLTLEEILIPMGQDGELTLNF